MLKINEISKTYAKKVVLNNITAEIPEGSIYGLLGPNGAGKTTLIRIITQIIMPDNGQVYFNNEGISRKHISMMGYLPEERGLYPKMKVGEQLTYLAHLKGMKTMDFKKEMQGILDEFEIGSWWNKKVETLSKGMQQKLQFIVSILNKPKLVILDEPFSGFDPINADLVKNKILEMRKSGTTFMLSTHRMESVEELCDNIMLINKACKIIEGNIGQIKQSYRKNLFEIRCRGNQNRESLPVSVDYQYMDIVFHNTDNSTEIKVQLSDNTNINKVLEQLLNVIEIMAVNEIVPSIHEIFVSTVKEDDNE